MQRYTAAYWLYVVVGPLVLGLITLILALLPGEMNIGRALLALAIYLVIAVAGGAAITRRLDR